MRNPSPLSIVSYLVFSVVLLGYGGSAVGQSSLPSAQEPTQESVNPSDFVPLPEEQSQFSSLTITPSPIVSTCPFPAITVSSQGQQAMDMGLTSTPSVYASESYTPGDGSDLDLDSRSSMLLSEGNVREALSLSQRIRDPQLQADSLLRIASSYVEAGQLDRALEIVQSLPETAEPPFYSRESVLQSIVTAYRNQGDLEQAVRVAEQMEDEGQSIVLREIASSYIAQGQPEKAAEVLSQSVMAFRAMSESLASGDESIFLFSKFVALASFASDYLELNQDAQAVEFLDEALADAKALPELPFSPGFEILSVIPELYKDAGHHDKAVETIAFAQEVAERYPQPIARSRALTQVAFSYLALDQPEQTEALLAQAEAVAKADQTASQESIVWVDLAKGYAALGQYDRAFQAIANVQPASLRDQVNETFVCSQEAS